MCPAAPRGQNRVGGVRWAPQRGRVCTGPLPGEVAVPAAAVAACLCSTTSHTPSRRPLACRYDEGEIVMQQGELASWVGIVLSGDLVACTSDGGQARSRMCITI